MCLGRHRNLIARGGKCLGAPTRRACSVVVVLDLVVAKQADLVAALARPEVLVRHVHVLHAEWAAWRRTTQGGGGSGS